MNQPSWESDVGRVLAYLIKTALPRFFKSVFIVGAGLVGVTVLDVVLHVAGMLPGMPRDSLGVVSATVGSVLIGVGIFGFLWVKWWEARLEQGNHAGALIGQLRILVEMFEPAGVKRDAGFGSAEIESCIMAARGYLKIAPKKFKGNAIITAISNGGWDASKKKPFEFVSLEAMKGLIDDLGVHYGIE